MRVCGWQFLPLDVSARDAIDPERSRAFTSQKIERGFDRAIKLKTRDVSEEREKTRGCFLSLARLREIGLPE